MAASSSSSKCGFEILPEDLVFRILLLLPVACLLRLKSVCKSWLSLIESSSFVYQHTNRSNSEDDQEDKLIIFNLNDVYPFSGHKFISVIDLQLSNHVDFKLNTDKKVSGVNLIGSFNGIICLKHKLCVSEVIQADSVPNTEEDPISISIDSISVVSLWNPATKHVKILPAPLLADSLITEGGNYREDYGFGFDVKTNDYMVVKVIVAGLTEGSNLLKSHVQVYSLNMDSWRVIDVVVPLKIWITSNPNRPFRNGICCWYGWDHISDCPAILSFDFSNEVFGIIPMFDDYQDDKVFSFLREKLACIQWVPDQSEHDLVPDESEYESCHCEIWVLDKCGMKESWTKLYAITLESLESRVCPMGFSADGMMVLRKNKYNGEAKLVLLDPARQEYNVIPSQGTVSEVAVYKESLVSVKGANAETYRVDSEWKAISSTWDYTVSQRIIASHDSFAGILDEDASGLIIFDEPKTALHLPAQTVLPTRWSPPLAGTIKLNTDAIRRPTTKLRYSTKLGTFGLLARNSVGTAVKAACSTPSPMTSLLTGKAEAVKKALLFALTAGWDSVIIESDCKRVVDSIKGSMIKGSSNLTGDIADIYSLSTRFKSISFSLVPRALNSAAHSLACHGFTCDVPCSWDTVMPDWLNDVLAKDLVC